MLKATLAMAVVLAVGTLTGADTVQLKPHTPLVLHAGPIEAKFQDGELRYIRAGGKEVVRRIYFAVRNKTWETPMPEFTRMEVENNSDSFQVRMAARCKSTDVDYEWSGTITGSKEGVIVFEADGTPNIDFGSGRIGLCTLFGAESLVGQSFETVDDKGGLTQGVFPEFVSPTLVAKKFQEMKYTTASGMKVSCKLEGATYDMEDQRNWGDTSFKAYAPLKYTYPNVKSGQHEHEKITLSVSGVPETKPASAVVIVKVGIKPIEGSKVPVLIPTENIKDAIGFVEANMNRKKHTDAPSFTFKYTSLTHLPDDDTLMENPRAVWHQARTARQFAPKAVIRYAPVGLTPAGDSRNDKSIAAAWTAVVVKYLALSDVAEMGFHIGPGPVDAVLKSISLSAGKPLLETEISADSGVDAFTVESEDGRTLWLINTSPDKHTVKVDGTGAPEKVKVTHVYGESVPEKPSDSITPNQVDLTLSPYEVCWVLLLK